MFMQQLWEICAETCKNWKILIYKATFTKQVKTFKSTFDVVRNIARPSMLLILLKWYLFLSEYESWSENMHYEKAETIMNENPWIGQII